MRAIFGRAAGDFGSTNIRYGVDSGPLQFTCRPDPPRLQLQPLASIGRSDGRVPFQHQPRS